MRAVSHRKEFEACECFDTSLPNGTEKVPSKRSHDGRLTLLGESFVVAFACVDRHGFAPQIAMDVCLALPLVRSTHCWNHDSNHLNFVFSHL